MYNTQPKITSKCNRNDSEFWIQQKIRHKRIDCDKKLIIFHCKHCYQTQQNFSLLFTKSRLFFSWKYDTSNHTNTFKTKSIRAQRKSRQNMSKEIRNVKVIIWMVESIWYLNGRKVDHLRESVNVTNFQTAFSQQQKSFFVSFAKRQKITTTFQCFTAGMKKRTKKKLIFLHWNEHHSSSSPPLATGDTGAGYFGATAENCSSSSTFSSFSNPSKSGTNCTIPNKITCDAAIVDTHMMGELHSNRNQNTILFCVSHTQRHVESLCIVHIFQDRSTLIRTPPNHWTKQPN